MKAPVSRAKATMARITARPGPPSMSVEDHRAVDLHVVELDQAQHFQAVVAERDSSRAILKPQFLRDFDLSREHATESAPRSLRNFDDDTGRVEPRSRSQVDQFLGPEFAMHQRAGIHIDEDLGDPLRACPRRCPGPLNTEQVEVAATPHVISDLKRLIRPAINARRTNGAVLQMQARSPLPRRKMGWNDIETAPPLRTPTHQPASFRHGRARRPRKLRL